MKAERRRKKEKNTNEEMLRKARVGWTFPYFHAVWETNVW